MTLWDDLRGRAALPQMAGRRRALRGTSIMSDKGRVGGKRKMGPLLEAVDRPKELVIPRVLHDQLSHLRSIMDWNGFFASLFVLSLAPVAVTAQTPAL
jgi:hypothetical protein